MAMKPFRLTAHTLRGVCMEPYGLDLAGILASRKWSEIRNDTSVDSMVERPDDLDLPLDMCSSGADWHWKASCAMVQVDEGKPQEPRTYYRVVNDSMVARAANRPLPYYHPRSSAYRDVMMPAPITLSPTLTWEGVGDLDKVFHLVKDIRSVGKRRSKGEGRIVNWSISEIESDDNLSIGHIDPNGRINRPIPVECADRIGVEYQIAWHAIRPPSWNPNRLREMAVEKEEELYLPEEWEL